MAKLVFIGAAQAVAQVETITFGGTWANGETASVTIGAKTVTYTAVGGSETPSTMAAGLQALLAASDEPEFSDITWTVNAAVITATGSTAGIPHTIGVAESSGSGTIADSVVTAATGPEFWDNVKNWSTGAAPTTSDEVYLERADLPVRYGLPTSLVLAKFVMTQGTLGLPDWNEAGYAEYRATRPIFEAAEVIIGTELTGPTLCRLNLGSDATYMTVYNSTTQRSGLQAIDVIIDDNTSTVAVVRGQVGIATAGNATSTLSAVRVGPEGNVTLGAGLTVASVISSGTVDVACNVTTLTVDAGTATIRNAATATTIEVRGGQLLQQSRGTITNLNVGPGIADFGRDIRARTVTNATLRPNGQIYDPFNVVTFTNGVTLHSTADRLTAS